MKRRSFPRLISCGLVYLALVSSASVVRAERLPVKIFTSADGLGSSFVNYLMNDSRGFLWICTRDGLSRFDGSRFVTYQIGEYGAPPGIEQILETRKGVYWISTTGGLFRFDPNAPQTADESKSAERATLKAEFVSDERGVLYEDHAGNLWLGGNSLYRVLDKDAKPFFEKVELSLPVNPSNLFGVVAFSEGLDGSLWLLMTWGVARRFADGKQIYYSIDDPRTNALTSILRDHDGRIWVGCRRGVYVIKPESREELSLLGVPVTRNLDKLTRESTYKDHINLPERPGEILRYSDAEGVGSGYGKFLYETADGHIWISTIKSLIDFDGHTFHLYTSAQGFLDGITKFAEDASGNLWLGGANGLIRWDRGGLTSYLTDDGLSDSNIMVTNQTRDEQLYVMTADLSLSLFDGMRFQTIRPALPENAEALWTANPVFQDLAGEWWFLTNEKLFRFAATKDFRELARQRPRATYDSHDGLKSDQMFHLWEDSHGDLWVSTRGSQPEQAGLSRWSRATEKFYTFTEADGFPSNKWVSSFAEDGNGNLWFGFYLGGLVRYAGGRFMELTSSDGAPGGLITALHADQQGRLWVGSSQSGLSRIDDPSAGHPRFTSVPSHINIDNSGSL
jgi:ligand-binding sensor domain-containing protein